MKNEVGKFREFLEIFFPIKVQKKFRATVVSSGAGQESNLGEHPTRRKSIVLPDGFRPHFNSRKPLYLQFSPPSFLESPLALSFCLVHCGGT